jgi:hypothetical protein
MATWPDPFLSRSRQTEPHPTAVKSPPEQAAGGENVPRQKIKWLAFRRAGRDRQDRRREAQGMVRKFRTPEQIAAVSVAQVAEMPLGGVPNQLAGDKFPVDDLPRPICGRVVRILMAA